MEEVKKFIDSNKIFCIISLILLSGFILFAIIKAIGNSQIYESGLTSTSEVPILKKHYQDNEYKIIGIEQEDVVTHYYKSFIQELINDPRSAWDKVYQKGEVGGIDFKGDYNAFADYIKKIITTKTANNAVKKYKYQDNTSYNRIVVIDEEKYKYEFYEYGMYDYKVAIMGQTSE